MPADAQDERGALRSGLGLVFALGLLLAFLLLARQQSCAGLDGTGVTARLLDILGRPAALLPVLLPLCLGYAAAFAAPVGRRIAPGIVLAATALAVLGPAAAFVLLMPGFCEGGLAPADFALRTGAGLVTLGLALRVLTRPLP